MNTGHYWTAKELSTLKTDYEHKPLDISKTKWAEEWGRKHGGYTSESVRGQLQRLQYDSGSRRIVQESNYPVYESPLCMEGDALILPDLEIPFHHAEFINRCLELSDKWKIKQAILAGDVLHFDSLSGWQPNWTAPNTGGLTADAESALVEFAKTLGKNQQGKLFGLIGDIGQRDEGDGVSTEMGIARKELHRLEKQFERIDFVLGNHEGRLLRAMETALNPDELLRLLESGDKWRVAPYYFSYLDTCAGRYQIEHPKNFGKFSAWKLASKHLCHILMAHSHQLNFTFDPSGQFYAIEMGACVDEKRLPYVAQRHNTAHTHVLGAVIVRGGIPWLLHSRVDWSALGNM